MVSCPHGTSMLQRCARNLSLCSGPYTVGDCVQWIPVQTQDGMNDSAMQSAVR